MHEDVRLCGRCGCPIEDGADFVDAEPLLRMRCIGRGEALVAGVPQSFHPHHLPATGEWRVLTT
jgi:hypothetical protein